MRYCDTRDNTARSGIKNLEVEAAVAPLQSGNRDGNRADKQFCQWQAKGREAHLGEHSAARKLRLGEDLN